MAHDLYTGFDAETGLFEQFQGYFELEDIDLASLEARTALMDVLLGRDRIQRCQAAEIDLADSMGNAAGGVRPCSSFGH